MARKYRRGGKWYLDWWENGARERHPCDATTEEEAERARAALELRLARGRVVLRGAPTLKKLIEDFLADKKVKRESATHDTYEKHAGHFARILPMALRASEVTPEHVEAYLRTRLEGYGEREDGEQLYGPISKITANKERVTLATIYNWAVRRRIVDANPVRAVDPFSVRPRKPEACPVDVYHALVSALRAYVRSGPQSDRAASRERMADMVEVMWWTALRAGEVCKIQPEDVDARAEAWTLTVRSASNKGAATIVIPEQVRPIFRRRLNMKRAFVFGLEDGSHGYRALYKSWSTWLKEHPEHRAAHFHALRHAFGRRCEEEDVDPRVTQSLMRHSTLRMTGHYSHRDLDALRDAHERLAPAARGRARGGRSRRGPPS